MYLLYCLFISVILSIMYEFSGLNSFHILNIAVSFILFLVIEFIISSPNRRYKINICIFSFVVAIISLLNNMKVRFQLAELSFFDVKLAKAATGVATLFLDKLPFFNIGVILNLFLVILCASFYFERFIDKYKNSETEDIKSKIEERFMKIDKIFYNKFTRIIFIVCLALFFVFSSFISNLLPQSSFSRLLLSSKSLAMSNTNTKKISNTILDIVKSDELSSVDEKDPLLKGFPFNEQKDIDVVFIQSETFFDLPKYQDKLGEKGIVVHDDTVSKNFHYYQKNGISGTFFVPTVGGGTVNTEYEALTGYSAKCFYRGCIVFTTSLKENTDSIIRYMKKNMTNVKATAIHNHNADYWERDRVYPLLGVDDFVDITQFTQEQQNDLVGAWMSDKTIFDMTIKKLEENKDKNNFLIPVTVQNHGPFLDKKGDYIKVDNLTEKEGWEIRNFVANLKYSDEQLKIFMDYIDSRQKPTIVVFYGDHKPDPNYDIFKNSAYYNENEKQKLFNTDYFIYFNNAIKDEKLLALKGIHEDMSSVAINRYIRILLGDTSDLNMYMYNYSKNEQNYYSKDIWDTSKKDLFKELSLSGINTFDSEEEVEKNIYNSDTNNKEMKKSKQKNNEVDNKLN